VPLGGLLLSWLQGLLLCGSVALLSGSGREALAALPWLTPGFVLPPLLLGAWSFRRFDPLTAGGQRLRWLSLAGLVLLASLAGWAVSLSPALEARDVLAVREAIQAGAGKLGFEPVGDPKLGLIALAHPERNVLAIADAMRARGWVSARTGAPPAIHLMLQPAHLAAVDDYLADLSEETARAPKGAAASGGGLYA